MGTEKHRGVPQISRTDSGYLQNPNDAAPRPAATRCSGPLTDFGRSGVAGDTHNRGHFTRSSAASLIARTRAFDGAQRPPCAVNRALASTTPTPASAVNALSTGARATSERLDS